MKKYIHPKWSITTSHFQSSLIKWINISIFTFALQATKAQTTNIQIKSNEKALEHLENMVEIKDHSFNQFIDKDASLDLITSGFGFTEGITWVPDSTDGYLLFSDMAANMIYRRNGNGDIGTFLEKSGYPYADIWRVGMRFNNGKQFNSPDYEEFNLIGSNGMILSKKGDLLVATWTGRSIDKISKNGHRQVLVNSYQGKRFGGTNDLVELKNGGIYFTDTFGSMIHPEKDPANEQKTQAVYYYEEGKNTLRVIDDIINTNGIAVSPDEKYLYASGSVDRYIRRYEIQKDKTVKKGELFVDLSNEIGEGITDGMKVDSKGNIWTTGPGGVWIISPNGKILGRIRVPAPCTNLVFGNVDKKMLYISTPGNIYKIQTKVKGL